MTDRSLRRSLVLAACFSLLAAMVTALSAGVAHADGFHVERWTGAWGSDGPITCDEDEYLCVNLSVSQSTGNASHAA
jgi:hypothetical protein